MSTTTSKKPRAKKLRCPTCGLLIYVMAGLESVVVLKKCRQCHRPYSEADASLWEPVTAGQRISGGGPPSAPLTDT